MENTQLEPPYRQGDVLIVSAKIPAKVSAVPFDARGIVLAEGEATGHAHTIVDESVEFLTTETEERFLRVLAEGGVLLTHQEHPSVLIPPGEYQVVGQREYSPEMIRRVAD